MIKVKSGLICYPKSKKGKKSKCDYCGFEIITGEFGIYNPRGSFMYDLCESCWRKGRRGDIGVV